MNLDFYCANRISDGCHTLTHDRKFGVHQIVPEVFLGLGKAIEPKSFLNVPYLHNFLLGPSS